MEKINLKHKFSLFQDRWSPKIIGELNGQYVKLAKLKGEFEWHHHADEDELFLVVKGSFKMKLREGDIVVREGEIIIIPKGLEHCPVAEEEAEILLFEPKSTLHTGNIRSERTVDKLAWV